MANESKPLLSIRNLNKQFGTGCSYCHSHKEGLDHNYCPRCGTVYALQNVNFDLYPQEILGIVGESGSGKSTLMQCLYFDQYPQQGNYHFQGEEYTNLFEAPRREQRRLRNEKFGMIYQNPLRGLRMNYSSLSNIGENLIAAGWRNVESMTNRAEFLLDQVKIASFRMKESPSHFSGGMQQRVQIAKALSNNPPVLFLDEVTTGLDLSVQAKVLDLIKEIQREYKVSMLLVSHDLSVVKMLADRALVMLNGQVIEEGLTDQILEDPQHQYTQELVHSLL
ncbi:ATP-binding cassette domain-containing protein [Spirochaeta cellobiosiphila]|uniref:ATP-binding cassette domain-containing protein n=1 Tax=Spirochaeta cellobiosiphila TaxID=504483 RepID=UPI00041CA835|nr:ATP-binding cassette domain-containing protein [Spirochaeta cellobiosiphila]